MNTALRVIGLLVVATCVGAAEMRTWTFAQSGTTMRAEAVGFTADAVSFKREDGKTVSVRIAYLSESDQTYLTAERAKQLKDVEIVSLTGVLAGQYRKYSVSGGDIKGEVLITRLPAAVDAILNDRSRQTAQISNLTAQIADQKTAVQQAKAAAKHTSGNRSNHRVITAERAQADQASGDLTLSQVKLAELQKAYDESVKKTRNQTTVKLRNTGIVYQRLPVWECPDPKKPAG